MPLSFSGFGVWALLLMLAVGILHHIASQRNAKNHPAEYSSSAASSFTCFILILQKINQKQSCRQIIFLPL